MSDQTLREQVAVMMGDGETREEDDLRWWISFSAQGIDDWEKSLLRCLDDALEFHIDNPETKGGG